MDKDVSILTEKQRQAWTLREQGRTYKSIAAEMGLSVTAVTNHVRNAERRFKEHAWYVSHERWNSQTANITLTNGECETLLKALKLCEDKIIWDAHATIRNYWKSRLPYAVQLIPPLIEKIETVLYGGVLSPSSLTTLELLNDGDDGDAGVDALGNDWNAKNS